MYQSIIILAIAIRDIQIAIVIYRLPQQYTVVVVVVVGYLAKEFILQLYVQCNNSMRPTDSRCDIEISESLEQIARNVQATGT